MKTPVHATVALFCLLALTHVCRAEAPNSKPPLNQKATEIRAKYIADLRAHPFPSRAVISSINNIGSIAEITTIGLEPNPEHKLATISGFIVGLGRPQSLVDGDSWKGLLYLAGIYKTEFGGTLRRFALTPEIAADLQIAELLAAKAKAKPAP